MYGCCSAIRSLKPASIRWKAATCTVTPVDPLEGRYVVTPDALGTVTYTLVPENEEGAPLPTYDLTVTVNPTPKPNSPPVANDDRAKVEFGKSVTIKTLTLLANDTDPDGDTLRVTAVSGAVGGTVSLSGGAVAFTHDGKTREGVAFTYTVSDNRGGTDTAKVAMTVPNSPPVANDDRAKVEFGKSVTIKTLTLLANDTDPDGDTLRVTAVSGAVGGTVSLSGGAVAFTHDGKTREGVAFTYTVSDNRGGTDTAKVAMTVTDPAAQARIKRVNKAILPEVSRAMVSGTLDAITRRIEEAGSGSARRYGIEDHPGLRQPLMLMADEEGMEEEAMFRAKALAMEGSSFAVGNGSAGMLGTMTFWGGGDWRSLSGGDGKSPVRGDGDVIGAHIGVDARPNESLLTGLALSWSRGSMDWTDQGEVSTEGTHETRMTSLHPYVSLRISDGTGIWASAGYGWGEVEINDGEVGEQSSDSTLATGAVGGYSRLFADDGIIGGGTTALTLRGEVWFSRLEVESGGDIEGMKVDTRRLRLGIEGSHEHRLSVGGVIRPSVEVGVRHDGGDGETGTGVEVGGGLAWSDATAGLTVEVHTRALVAHEGEVEEWGVRGSIRIDPGSDKRGLSLGLNPSYRMSDSRLARLWAEGVTEESIGGNGAARVEAELGYGMSAMGERGVVTPYSTLAVSDDGARDYRVGGRLEIGESLAVGIEGERRESGTDGAGYGVLLRGTANW